MGFKKKVFGFVAAAALTLSMAGGVAAQTSDSVSGSVVLAPGTCKVSIVQGNVSFGTWTWNGSAYAHTGGHNVVTLNANLETHKPGGECKGTIAVSGLTNGTETIPASHFSGKFTSDYGSYGPVNLGALAGNPNATSGSFNFPGVGPGNATAELTLESVPNTFAPGTYNGSVTVTVSTAN